MTAPSLQAVLLPVDGTPLRVVDVEHDWSAMAKVIGGDYVEHVRTQIPGVALIVDEEGALRSDRVLNRLALGLYPGRIFGAALVLSEVDTPEGRDVASLSFDHWEQVADVILGQVIR